MYLHMYVYHGEGEGDGNSLRAFVRKEKEELRSTMFFLCICMHLEEYLLMMGISQSFLND